MSKQLLFYIAFILIYRKIVRKRPLEDKILEGGKIISTVIL